MALFLRCPVRFSVRVERLVYPVAMEVAESRDFALQTLRTCQNRWCVEKRTPDCEFGWPLQPIEVIVDDGIELVPMRVVAGGERFPHTGRSMADTDIAVLPAGIAELSEAPVLLRNDKGGCTTIRSCTHSPPIHSEVLDFGTEICDG